MLASKIEKKEIKSDGEGLKALLKVIIPLVNYTIFGGKSRKQS